jgi:hypothetical protein
VLPGQLWHDFFLLAKAAMNTSKFIQIVCTDFKPFKRGCNAESYATALCTRRMFIEASASSAGGVAESANTDDIMYIRSCLGVL